MSITIDTTPPVAPTSLANISDSNDSTPTITGTAEPGSTVTLFNGPVILGTATVDSDGTAGHIALMPDGNVGIGTVTPGEKLDVVVSGARMPQAPSAHSVSIQDA